MSSRWIHGSLAAAFLLCAGAAAADEWGAVTVRERSIAPGTKSKFSFATERSIEAVYLDPPLWVARGAEPGPMLCVTAAIHGDELNGTEIARRTFARVDPTRLRGTLVVLPIVNAAGFRTSTRYMPDRRDLNRYFPGRENGSLSSFVAFALFDELIQHCDALVDLHTGSLRRTNVPQIRVDLAHPRALEMARQFAVGVVLGGSGPEGSLRRAAMDAGIPTILYEAGAPDSFQEEHIAPGVRGLENTLAHLGLLPPLPADHAERRALERCARQCPVHQSVHPDIDVPIDWTWQST